MTYQSIEELPLHCRLNLPEEALHVYRDAWNRAWNQTSDPTAARACAWDAVRSRFERDTVSGRWMAKAEPLVPCVAELDVTAEPVQLQAAAVM